MDVRCGRVIALVLISLGLFRGWSWCQTPAASDSSSSSSPKHLKKPAPASSDSGIDAGSVTNGLYRNRALAMSCKIPDGWVLRTEEMNARDQDSDPPAQEAGAAPKSPSAEAKDARAGKVLLAAFSRPPAAHGEDVNSSILIAAESISAYPGLKEAGQYFEPLTEVATAQGFIIDEEPYEIALGEKILVRGDFHKDVASRVMRQSTLAFLSHGYAVSITVIGGTEDEVEELLDGVEFQGK
jgi:hypothetical protein